MPYSKDMIKQHDGMFLLNETAANDPAVQGAMASYMQQLQREAAHRKAVRDAAVAGGTEILTPESDFPSWGASMGQWARWNISDRD